MILNTLVILSIMTLLEQITGLLASMVLNVMVLLSTLIILPMLRFLQVHHTFTCLRMISIHLALHYKDLCQVLFVLLNNVIMKDFALMYKMIYLM